MSIDFKIICLFILSHSCCSYFLNTVELGVGDDYIRILILIFVQIVFVLFILSHSCCSYVHISVGFKVRAGQAEEII